MRVTPRDALGHADHSGLRCGIVPVLGRIAAIGGAASDVDDPAALLQRKASGVAEMADREAAQVGAGLEVDAQRAAPGGVPCLVVGVVGDILEHPGIVDEHVDPAVEPGDCGIPQRARRGGVGEVGGQEVGTALRAMPGDDVAGVPQVA